MQKPRNKIKKIKLWGKVANCCLALQYEHFCVVFAALRVGLLLAVVFAKLLLLQMHLFFYFS